jgi:UDP-N-acetylmuramoyl-tripeptide--D-alanyl-D-alanine ligase
VGRRFAVLGEMRELGEATAELHREMAAKVAKGPWAGVYFVGPSAELVAAELRAQGFRNNVVVSNTYENFIAADLRGMLRPGDLVLLKGSRGVALEKFLADLHPTKPLSKH